MILDVALIVREVRMDRSFEACEDALAELADDVGDHVQPAAMRHADGYLVNAPRRGAFDQLVENGDDGLVSLDREPLLPEVLRAEELLEQLGRDELPENLFLDLDGNVAGGSASTRARIHSFSSGP